MEVKQVKDFKVLLKDFEPIVKGVDRKWRSWLINGNNLDKKIDVIPLEYWWTFKMRYREAWANRLLCVFLQARCTKDITFLEDEDGDGIILDKKSWIYIRTEHVCALDSPSYQLSQGENRIIDAINIKIAKWPAYAKGKHLVIFFDGAWKWYRNKVRENIKGRHHFDMVYCIGLISIDQGWYSYIVTEMPPNIDNSFSSIVQINSGFTDWNITNL